MTITLETMNAKLAAIADGSASAFTLEEAARMQKTFFDQNNNTLGDLAHYITKFGNKPGAVAKLFAACNGDKAFMSGLLKGQSYGGNSPI